MKQKTVVTISRQYGSGGRVIGELLAKRLGVPFYDRELINLAAAESGYDKSVMESVDETSTSSLLYSLSLGTPTGLMDSTSLNDRVFMYQSRVIREVAERGSCVIVGRCADYILENQEDIVSVFIHADLKSRVRRAVEQYGIPAERAEAVVKKTDKRRAAYHEYYANNRWPYADYYDLTLDSERIGFEHAVELIASYVEYRAGRA